MSMQEPVAQREHQWLARLVGEWTAEGEADAMQPGQSPDRITGTETVRMLGDVWVVLEGTAEAPGSGTGRNLMTLGYDPAKGRFVGTFIGSMMTNLWIYDGALDESGAALVLDSEGPSFTGEGEMGRYRDTIEIRGDDHRVMTSSFQQPDGTWKQFMTMHYRRVK